MCHGPARPAVMSGYGKTGLKVIANRGSFTLKDLALSDIVPPKGYESDEKFYHHAWYELSDELEYRTMMTFDKHGKDAPYYKDLVDFNDWAAEISWRLAEGF